MNHKKILIGIMLLLGSVCAQAAAKYGNLDDAGSNVFDRASLQRGAALFSNYCMACHSASFMRYQRLSDDLDLTEEEIRDFLVFGEQDMADYMLAAMRSEDAVEWLGAAAPDLSLTARSRGADWIYTFLRSYYLTDEGWNNRVLENPSMPHVMWDLQGVQRAVTDVEVTEDGETRMSIIGLELDQPGRLTQAEYNNAVRDIVAFMEYIAEPAILKRERIGIWVLLFLSLFTFLAYLLKEEFWKDVKK